MSMGRPTVMTDIVLGKLQEAFAYDATIEEACFYADINPDTYYTYVKTNKDFSERVKALRQRPVLAARKKIVQEIETDVATAKWYLERKRNKEFSTRTEEEHSGQQKLIIETRKHKTNTDDGDGNAED